MNVYEVYIKNCYSGNFESNCSTFYMQICIDVCGVTLCIFDENYSNEVWNTSVDSSVSPDDISITRRINK